MLLGFLVLCFCPVRQNRPVLDLHSRFLISLNAGSTSEAEEVGSPKSIFAIGTPLSGARFFFWARLPVRFARSLVVFCSWLSNLFWLHFHGLFVHISSFQGRQLKPNCHEIDLNLVALRRRNVCCIIVHSLALSCL